MPFTWAMMVPAVLLLPLIASDITSSRGTVAKAPIYSAVAVVMPLEVTVWELVVAWPLMVPVFSKPPTLVTGTVVVMVTPLTVLVTCSVTAVRRGIASLADTDAAQAGEIGRGRALDDHGGGARARHRSAGR